MSSLAEYRNPPVHEVILSLHVTDPVEDAALEELSGAIPPKYSRRDRSTRIEAEISVGPTGTGVNSKTVFDGWLFKTEDQSRVLQTAKSQVSFQPS